MFLYLPLLISKLFCCECLTSMEIFDVFDFNADLEPVIDNTKTSGSFIFHRNTAVEHSTAKAVNYSTVTVENYNNARVEKYRNATENYSSPTVNNYSNATVEHYSSATVDNSNNATVEHYSSATIDNYNNATVKHYISATVNNYSNAPKNYSSAMIDNYNNATVENYSSPSVDNYSNAMIDNTSGATNRNQSPKHTTCNNMKCAETSNNNEENHKNNVTETLFTPANTTNTDKHYTKWIYNTYEDYTNSGKDVKNLESTIKISGNVTSENGNSFAKTVNNSKLDIVSKSRTLPIVSIPQPSSPCSEEESPANIGAYEVPTQRDVALHIRNHLRAMYHGFHSKAMHFLKDVKQATQASWSRKMFCRGTAELMHYRRCVRWVGEMSVLTTKSLVTALETARHNINTFMQGKICNISSLNVDPIHLIRILAAEKVSLEFALPDFLRQLNACARYCPSTRITLPREYLETAHLTDRDFVIRHYLTQQNYNQQLKQHYKI